VSAGREVRLWAAQRATAAVLALCVAVHLVTLVYAVRGGLTAAEILERTRGSVAWAAFYGVFVLAAALHAGIGVRNTLSEWLGLKGDPLELAATVFALLLTIMGLRAVWAVFA
jgi:fumarate reductase subunit C